MQAEEAEEAEVATSANKDSVAFAYELATVVVEVAEAMLLGEYHMSEVLALLEGTRSS